MDPKPSASPDRHTFQREGYLRRCAEEGTEPNADYLSWFDQVLTGRQQRFDDAEAREQDLEWHLLSTDWILTKVRSLPDYGRDLYAALCNNQFQRQDIMPVLRDQRWSCTWRYAGGIIADMMGQGDYIDWYCAGREGEVTDEVRADLLRLGWSVCDDRKD